MKNEEFFRLHWNVPEGETVNSHAHRIFPIAQRMHVYSARHGSARMFAAVAAYWHRKLAREKTEGK